MSQLTENPPGATTTPSPAPAAARRGRWIDHWDTEDQSFWEREGRFVARRNLAWSITAEHIGFSIWVLWTIVGINLSNVGISLSVSELFLLTAVPNLVGAFLRIPYTFAYSAWAAATSPRRWPRSRSSIPRARRASRSH